MLKIATNRQPKLLAIATLFDALHEQEIVYCNLKGNDQHLQHAMTGESDIDVLFDEKQKTKIELLLGRLGFKLFVAIEQRRFKDIVDFISLDHPSGKVIHLHTHYAVTVGEPFLKGYQLPMADHILNSRVFNAEFGLYCIQPALEFILLYITESLKLRHRDFVRMLFTTKITFREKAIYQHNWLRKNTSISEAGEALKTIFSDHSTLNGLIRSEFDRRQLQRLAPKLKKELSVYRLYSSWAALRLRWYREAMLTIRRKISGILLMPVVRVNPRGGIVVAISGRCGAGNSSITNLLKETFGKKIDVVKVSFASWNHLISPSGNETTENSRIEGNVNVKIVGQEVPPPTETSGSAPSFSQCLSAIITAQALCANLKRVQYARKKGVLVLCDCYPQPWATGNTGAPLLHGLLTSRNPIFRTLAIIEKTIYAQTENISPDLLFTLCAGDRARQTENGGGRLPVTPGERNTEITPLTLVNKCKVVAVDATASLNELLHVLKKEIWTLL